MAPALKDEIRARRGLPEPGIRKLLRKQAGFSLRRLAAEIPVAHTTFARWEAGTAEPRGEHLIAYAALLRELQEAIAS